MRATYTGREGFALPKQGTRGSAHRATGFYDETSLEYHTWEFRPVGSDGWTLGRLHWIPQDDLEFDGVARA